MKREADAKMKRTQGRPLPSGRLSAGKSAVFRDRDFHRWFRRIVSRGKCITAWLGLFTLLSYLFIYTPLKQRSPHSTTIGRFPGRCRR